jgi:hypothetical protein
VRKEKKSAEKPTKIEPLRGYIEIRYVRCGRANCKCSKGELHGPYHLRRWTTDGRKVTKYVKNSEKQTVLAAVSAYKKNRIKQHQTRERDRQLVREIRGNNKEFSLMLQLIRKGAIKL